MFNRIGIFVLLLGLASCAVPAPEPSDLSPAPAPAVTPAPAIAVDAGTPVTSAPAAPATVVTMSGSDGGSTDGAACGASDSTSLAIDASGVVSGGCNAFGISGRWSCIADSYGSPGNDCAADRPPFTSSSGMCVSGTLAASYSAFAGIALSIGGDDARPYDAQSHGVVGFAITITGNTHGAELRFGFNGPNATTSPSYITPFVSEPGPDPSGTTYSVLLADALVPPGWSVDDPGAVVDPTALTSLQVQIAGQTSGTEPYSFCVTQVRPILAAAAPSCGAAAGTICGVQDIAEGVGDYAVQNNTNGNLLGQCVRASTGPSCGAAFDVSFPGGSFGNGGNAPSSFPSVVYGWQNGVFYGGYQRPLQVSAVHSVPTTWSYSAGSGNYDAAYDVWFGSTSGGSTPAMELMIWVGDAGPQPAGSDTNRAVSIGGSSWEVWKGTVSSWPYVAYRSKSPSAAATVSLDLEDFFKDAIANAGLSRNWYLWGVQAGFEIYRASSTFSTTAFTVDIE
jgi:hypothetical protein